MNRPLYFGTAFVVTCETGCPEEGMPFEIEDRFHAKSKEEAEEWIARSGWGARLPYSVEERTVLTDGQRFVPTRVQEFQTLEGVPDRRPRQRRARKGPSK